MTSKDRAIKSLIEFNKQHNSISFRDYRKSNYKPSYQDIIIIFGSWQEAIKAADIKVEVEDKPKQKISKPKPDPFNTTVWMNVEMVDMIARRCTIHKGGCHLEKAKLQTSLKGINELLEHGGWLKFDTIDQARDRHTKHFKQTELRLCRICCRDEVRQAFKEKWNKTT